MTGGGQLLATARANGVPVFTYEFRGQPRAALGWSFMPLLTVVHSLGLMPGLERDVEEALAVMEERQERIGEEVPAAGNQAKQIAQRLHGKLPVIYGAGPLTAAAHRWKSQLNENSKVWSFYEELPEANHNAILGYELPQATASSTAAVFLQSNLIHPRVRLRYEFTQRMLEKAGVETLVVEGGGQSALAQILSTVLLGDYVSYYLALLNGVDPSVTTAIDNLKAWLAQQGLADRPASAWCTGAPCGPRFRPYFLRSFTRGSRVQKAGPAQGRPVPLVKGYQGTGRCRGSGHRPRR